MTKCAGCGHTADLYAKHNESIKICTPCSKLLWRIEWKSSQASRYPHCECCDMPIFHGGIVCPSCVRDANEWMYKELGLDLMHNNPFVHRLNTAAIRFAQYLNLKHPSAAEGWIRFWPVGGARPGDGAPADAVYPGIVTVDFERLVYGKENST